ncbi:alpha/beta hydrolase [Kribbella sp. NPDC051770]|uniref:alpha/beta fold hydrolase n=1 Tax=Kribbella sp. NPDC051770 TaxID=3155413 RepID=UPI00343069F5
MNSTEEGDTPQRLSRRGFVGTAAAVTGVSLAGAWAVPASAGTPEGFGAVSTSPNLPSGFGRTFKSRFVHANGIRQHVVVGGDGPPLLLIHGWPENWYAWRFLMPALAKDFTVIAVDQRGIGLTDKARDGYDTATLADDLAALMTALGHQRFSVVGHDTGYIIGYALAADHRDRVDRLVVAEIPGPPGLVDPDHAPPPLFVPAFLNDKLWHIPFNGVNDELIVDMVRSNADAYYRYEYTIQGGGPPLLPESAIKYYVTLYTRDRATLRASFGLYRAWDAILAQNVQRQADKLTISVLGIGGANSWGPAAADGIRPAATNVQGLVVPNAGHWLAEQAPAVMIQAVRRFLTA